MGPDTETTTSEQADAFFAQFIDATDETIARVTAERDGNLAAVVAESKAFGYWDRKIASRAARATARQRITLTATIAAATRTAHPDETARRAPLPATSLATLPPRRITRLTDTDRRATATYWRRLTDPDRARILARHLQLEARRAEEAARRTARTTRRAAQQWRDDQRAFERAQWRQVLARQADRRRKQVANRWVAISEQRALEIALQALAGEHPPQARK